MAFANLSSLAAWSYIDGRWVEGNPPIMGPMSQGYQFASMVFDGARSFDGVVPDLEGHCARLLRSAKSFELEPKVDLDTVIGTAIDGVKRFPREVATYIRPVMYADDGMVQVNPDSTKFVMTVFAIPFSNEMGSFSTGLSPYRRPGPDMAPTDAKAACLYPMTGRALNEGARRGIDNPVMLDPEGNVAEFASANLFMVKDGVVHTPKLNGTFLAGVTRKRVMELFAADGIEVVERSITYDELKDADELFSTGNFNKVASVNRIEDRNLQPGPIARKAWDLYFAWARDQAY